MGLNRFKVVVMCTVKKANKQTNIQTNYKFMTNLSMAWIDHTKAYDMVPHPWMVGAAKNMISIISNCFVNWKTVLTSGGAEIGQVVIRRGIFQGDSLSPLLFILVMLPLTQVLPKIKAGYKMARGMRSSDHLLFMDDLKLYGATKDQLDSLIHAVKIFSNDTRILLGLEKCAVLETGSRGSGIVPPDDQNTGEVEEEGYRYLSILKLDQILNTPNTKMKGKIVFV